MSTLNLVLLIGDAIYGTTFAGGADENGGVIFRVSTDGSESEVANVFEYATGDRPVGGLCLADGAVYGTTTQGGGPIPFILYPGVIFKADVLSISSSPSSLTAERGATASLSAKAGGLSPYLHYQWVWNAANIDNATNATLVLTNVQYSQIGAYAVVITNMDAALTSAPAFLNVIAPVTRNVIPSVVIASGQGTGAVFEYADKLPAEQWHPLFGTATENGVEIGPDLSSTLPARRFYRARQANGSAPTLNFTMAMQISVSGQIGESVRIDTIDAVGPTNAWTPLGTVVLTNTSQPFYDVTAFGAPKRLYRLVSQ